MKKVLNRFWSLLVVLAMILPMIPTFTLPVNAAGTLSTISGLTATWTDASDASGSASWSASGTGITGTATGYQGKVLKRTIYSTLTLKNTSGEEATLSFEYTLTGGGKVENAISGNSGTYSKTLANDARITIELTSPSGVSTNTLSITGLSLVSTSAKPVTIHFATENVVGGSYSVNEENITSLKSFENVTAGTKFDLVAVPESNYQFFGWLDQTNDEFVSYDAEYTLTATKDATYYPCFVPKTTALFGVGAAKYDDLTEAGEAAAAGSIKTIILLNNGTVSGNHIIPAGTTLLVPFDDQNTLYTTEPAHTNNNMFDTANWVQPTAYRTLTLAADANITVNGDISISGKHFAGGGNPAGGGCGVPTEKVGFVNMLSGSKITLNSGANLYAWGYITGAGTIDALSGSKVYENFQIRDFRGGGATTTVANDGIVFPLSQYYVQNIEVSTNYHYGAEEHVYTSLYISGASYSAGVKFIGDGAMFQPQSGAVLTKDYIENKDRLELTVNGNAALANMSLSLAGTNIDSSTFILPITNNITININSGTTTLKQDIALLPGAELNIAHGAVLNLYEGTGSGTISDGSGYNLFVYDSDEWSSGYNINTFNPDDIAGSEKTTGLKFVHQSYQFIALNYVPGRTYTRTIADLKDVKIDVNGTIVADGFLYTTAGGAQIISSGKTGVIAMNSGAGAEQYTYQACQVDTTPVYYAILCNSAQLKNGDGTYLDTTGATAGTTYNYCATHDQWYTGECADCALPATVKITWIVNGVSSNQDVTYNTVPVYNNGTNPPAKFEDNVHYTFAGWATTANGTVLTSLPAATEDATYYAIFNDGATHTYGTIATGGQHKCTVCQKPANCSDKDGDGNHLCDLGCGASLSNCTPGNDDGDCTTPILCTECNTATTDAMAHDYQIKNGTAGYTDNGTTHTEHYACQNSGCNATKDVTGVSHTYDEDTHECVCTAVETYTITWKIGDKTWTTTVNHGDAINEYEIADADIPENCYSYKWEDVPATATEGTTIEGYWTVYVNFNTAEGEFISFKQYPLGTELYLNPNSSQIDYYEAGHDAYLLNTLDNQKYKIESDGTTYGTVWPTVTLTGNMSLKPVYEINTYTITWKNLDGEELYFETVEYGKTPAFNNYQTPLYPDDLAEEGYTYTWIGWSEEKSGEKLDAIPAATGDATYYAVYDKTAKSYTVTWNVDGVFYKETTVAYGGTITAPTAPTKTGHTFSGWDIPATMPARNITLDAGWTVNKNDIIWNVDGTKTKTEDVEYGTVITLPETAPTKEGYTFTGWAGYTNGMTMPDEDVTFTAQWQAKTYTVTWTVDGEIYTTTEATYGQAITLPETDPTKTGHTFAGWLNVPETMPANENLTIEADFTANVYQVNWDANGGYFYNQTYFTTTVSEATYGQVIQTPPYNAYAKRTGYTFTGWNTKADGIGDALTAETIMTGTSNTEVIYYAQWECAHENTKAVSNDDGATHKLVCTNEDCNEYVVDESVDCSGGEATCMALATCEECGQLYGTVNSENHTGNNTTGVNASKATCTEDGYTGDTVCECGKTIDKGETIPATGHTPGEPFCAGYILEPTCEEDGSEQWLGFCTECSAETLTEFHPVPALGHDYVAGDEGWHEIDGWPCYGVISVCKNDPYHVEYDLKKGIQRVPYPTVAIDGNTYAPNADDVAYYENKGETFIDKDTALFVFDENGKFQSTANGLTADSRWAVNGQIVWHVGLVENDGAYYYFKGDAVNGGNVMATGDVYVGRNTTELVVTIGGVYTFGTDGKLCNYNGITEVNGVLRYYESAQLMLGNGLTKVEGEGETKYIYVNSNGELVVDAEYYVPANTLGIVSGMYTFDENGYMINPVSTGKNGIYRENDGWFYYENGVKAYNAGLIVVDANWYDENGDVVKNDSVWVYVRSNGQLAVGTYYVTNVNDSHVASGTKCEFNTYGVLHEGKEGIVAENGSLYYYKDNQIVYGAGLIKLGDSYYYVKSSGEVVNNCSYWITNVNETGIEPGMFVFDENGVMQIPESYGKTGIFEGYFYENGKIAYAKGLISFDGKYYYVCSNGQVATGEYWITNTNGLKEEGYYEFNDNGIMITE